MCRITTLYPRLPDFVDPQIEKLQSRVAALAIRRKREGHVLAELGPQTSVQVPEEFAVVLQQWKQLQRETPAKSRSAFRQWEHAIEKYQSLVAKYVKLDSGVT